MPEPAGWLDGRVAVGLEDGDAQAGGQLLARRYLELLLAAGGAVGLGEDEGDLVAGVDQRLEAGNSEFGGSAEDQVHGRGDQRGL